MAAKRERTQSSKKLLGAENSETRTALIDAAEKLMREEGYAAVSSRRIATVAGLKHQVIYYYFDTLDDLFLAVFRRGAEIGLAPQRKVLESDRPLRELWEINSDPRGNHFIREFIALASHNDVIRAEIARFATETRRIQAEAIDRHLQARGVQPRISPMLVSFLMAAIGRLLVNEESLGVDLVHDEATQLVETILSRFEEIEPGQPTDRLFEAP
jgi:AcrR family transcriptional regulator